MERDEMTTKILTKIFAESGRQLDEFVQLVRENNLKKHGEIRSYFKDEHGLSYGYANTLAHIVRDEIEGTSTGDALVDSHYTGKEHLRPIYDAIINHVQGFGDDVEISPKKSYVSLRRKKQFGLLQPSTKTRFDVGLIIKGKEVGDRLEDGNKWNGMCTHRVKLGDESQVDDQLISWLKEAYENAG